MISKVTLINQPPIFYSSNTKHWNLSFSSTFSPPPTSLPFTSTSLFSVSHKLLLSQFNLFSVLALPVLLLTGFTPSLFPLLVPADDCSHLQHPLQTPCFQQFWPDPLAGLPCEKKKKKWRNYLVNTCKHFFVPKRTLHENVNVLQSTYNRNQNTCKVLILKNV